MSGSLFDRLTLGVEAAAIDEDESIRRHIHRMLTIRQGAVQTLPDYGLSDLNDLNFSKSDLLAECCRAITACIEQYEPRLTQVNVKSLPEKYGDFTMAFAVSALKIDENGKTTPWQWSLSLDGQTVKSEDL